MNDIKTSNGTLIEQPPEPRWMFYLLSGLVPIAGIIIGLLYYNKPDEECKRFGKTCLYIGGSIIAAIVLMYLSIFALYFAIIVIYIVIIVVYFVFIFAVLIFGVAGSAMDISMLAEMTNWIAVYFLG